MNDEDVNRWRAFGGESWDEWHISGPTRRVVISHAMKYLEFYGFMWLEDRKEHRTWHIEWKDGKAVIL